MDGSGLDAGSDQFLGIILPLSIHMREPKILASKANILEVRMIEHRRSQTLYLPTSSDPLLL